MSDKLNDEPRLALWCALHPDDAAAEIERLRAENKTLFNEQRIAMNLLREITTTLNAVATERDKLKQSVPQC